ncbi:LIM-domain-containing protein [Auriculariales sp. MPI-PUGE-AT-0066]|nr:LIM-domain-containing protein [Auriculariales sp. MPI-PUGE-AT-0066]
MNFGGTAYCPTCDRAVYAAEKVMGPGRKLYHKMCLKCTSCMKRLDQGSLVEHNQEPYCKNCHVRLFGTRDLRSANLSPSTSNRTTTNDSAEFFPPLTTTHSFSPTTSPKLGTSQTPAAYVPSPDSTEEDLLPTPPSEEVDKDVDLDGKEDVLLAQSFLDSDPAGKPFTSPPALLRQAYTGPHGSPARTLKPTATGTSSPSKVQMYSGSLSGSPGRRFGGGTPLCPTCNNAVYFAEQVKACGRVWHKRCLRCVDCDTLLDSNRLTEREGDPMCRSCYSKTAGPQGAGYALHGRRGA